MVLKARGLTRAAVDGLAWGRDGSKTMRDVDAKVQIVGDKTK